MRSHYVAQAGLELMGSSNSPVSMSQVAGIPGMSHHTQPYLILTRATGRMLGKEIPLNQAVHIENGNTVTDSHLN
jgi:hypothetical protein